MFIKVTAYTTLACFVFMLTGCYSNETVSRTLISKGERQTIVKAVTVDGDVFEFQEFQGECGVVQDTVITGVLTKEGKTFSDVRDSIKYKFIPVIDERFDRTFERVFIPLSMVDRVVVKKFDVGRTILGVLGGTVLVVFVAGAIALATKQSCPFIYSYDGERFVFDGEPYGGAICEGLKRTDWCRLERLKPTGGEYRLLMTNEVNETQYTDEFKLWLVDHQPGVEVYPDAAGNLYVVQHPLKPIEATDTRGKNLLRRLSETDDLFWESDLRSKDPNLVSDRRDTLLLAFPRPPGKTTAKLVVSGSTTLWGSAMLKRLTELRGEQVGQWFQELKDPASRALLDTWNMREELWYLHVNAWIGGKWIKRGTIIGGGPFMTEDRIVPLDLSGVEGDTLKILMAPPAGFWQLNSFAIDYSQMPAPQYQEIAATSIIGDDGADVRDLLSSTDGKYYAMPVTGQSANLVFQAFPIPEGSVRTIFAKVSGYYDIRMNASGPPQTEVLDRIIFEPGFAASFALGEFHRWRSEQLGSVK